MAPAAPSSIMRLSTRDVAPADRLSYASWILSSSRAFCANDRNALGIRTGSDRAGTAVDRHRRAEWFAGARFVRDPKSVARLSAIASWSWSSAALGVASLTRARFGAGDLIFYDSRDPLDCDLLRNWNDLNLQLSEQFVRKWVPRPAVLTGTLPRIAVGAPARQLRRPVGA